MRNRVLYRSRPTFGVIGKSDERRNNGKDALHRGENDPSKNSCTEEVKQLGKAGQSQFSTLQSIKVLRRCQTNLQPTLTKKLNGRSSEWVMGGVLFGT